MKQYLDLLQNIIDNGVEKESGRENMPNTIGLSRGHIVYNLQDGFPLLTTKQMYWKGIVAELLWFLRGDTNIKYLVDNNVHIWDQDAYRWYLKKCKSWINGSYNERSHNSNPLEFDRFISLIKEINSVDRLVISKDYTLGDLGKVYGYQWRNQNEVDQVKECLEGLQNNPYSRYHIIDSWNKADFPEMALSPCHCFYQFIVRPLTIEERFDYVENYTILDGSDFAEFSETLSEIEMLDQYNIPRFYLDLNMYQRSCDTMLGVPFNIGSMSLLTHIFAKACNMVPGEIEWNGGDTHLYLNHLDLAKMQLTRKPKKLPRIKIKKGLHSIQDIESLEIEDIELQDYEYWPAIKAELFTGLKK